MAIEVQTKWFAETTPVNAKKATAEIGSGDNGKVTTTYDSVGTEGNNYEIAVVAGTGVNTALSAALADGVITVTLGTTPAVKASTTLGTGDNGIITITADTAGAAGNDFTIAVSDAGASDCDMTAVLSGSDITVTLGKTGASLAAAKNTATLIATAIAAIDGVTATKSGTGADSLTAAVVKKNLEGGDDGGDVSTPKNTATLIAAAITALDGFTAAKSGTGADSITSATSENVAFTGGQYATPSIMGDVWLYIGTTYYRCSKPCDKYTTDAWQSVAFTTL